MSVALVEKYGVIPKDAMPETAQSCNTSSMNRTLNQALKAAAVQLRKMMAAGEEGKAEGSKNAVLDQITSILCSCSRRAAPPV